MTITAPSPERSKNMSRVRNKDTYPEIFVRRIIWSLGFRYRLHVRTLPGTPDIVLPRLHKIVQVHGCFWHGHRNCPRATIPSTNTEFWEQKISANRRRDRHNAQLLRAQGWSVLTVWTCKLNDPILPKRIARFLNSTPSRSA